ncbi:MAG TPA: endolytic transglycosylase MltG [Candidatus Magasanikbacteria bacterium]|nr:endolytic transglycosylase MltG [Candidatus Magasanikbacteria bacterium]
MYNLRFINNFYYKFLGLGTLLILSLVGSYFFYRHNHPKYIPLPPRPEITLTIIPGWDLRDVAEYLVAQKLASSTADVYALTGEPAKLIKDGTKKYDLLWPNREIGIDIWSVKPDNQNYEGYLGPETVRVFQGSSVKEILSKFLFERAKQIDIQLPSEFPELNVKNMNWHEILTMASILEREVRNLEDKKLVADIFWRRLKKNWALQADSTVHYAVGKEGNVFTTNEDRQTDSLWNTYKYPGLPPGPICNPGLESIQAALYPEANNYWYFLTDKNGAVHYAKTLEEQNSNKYKYLK